jgi:hypothetical protein
MWGSESSEILVRAVSDIMLTRNEPRVRVSGIQVFVDVSHKESCSLSKQSSRILGK